MKSIDNLFYFALFRVSGCATPLNYSFIKPSHMSITVLLLFANLFITLVVVIFLLVLMKRRSGADAGNFKSDLLVLGVELNKLAPLMREEQSRGRDEAQRMSREMRDELGNSVKVFSEGVTGQFQNLLKQLGEQGIALTDRLATMAQTNEAKFEKLIEANDTSLREFRGQLMESFKTHREETGQSTKENRVELTASLKAFEDKFTQNVKDFNELQRRKFQDLVDRQEQVRTETGTKLEKIRETVEGTLEKTREAMVATLEKMRETVEGRLDKTRETVENRLSVLQEENGKKLEEMRNTVDEKLQSSVEKRFNESFKLISERLDLVHKGLGEMQTLASGVGDLKKVLTNVKTRGSMGEVQLGAILEEIFSISQYERNVALRAGSQERVEFAVKFPGRNDDNQPLLLPIDSKFPVEDYQRLIDAYENVGSIDGKIIEAIGKQFESAVRKCARDIRDKYINPPLTTDFAILFVPTEGLYAEILRRPGLFDGIRREHNVTIVGPTNLVAYLSSLQMGFRTLAIEKRSSEVWEILGAVKSEFSKFGIVLAKTKKKLEEATNTIDQAGVRTRAIERQLRKVQELPQEQAVALIGQTLEMETQDIKDEEQEGVE